MFLLDSRLVLAHGVRGRSAFLDIRSCGSERRKPGGACRECRDGSVHLVRGPARRADGGQPGCDLPERETRDEVPAHDLRQPEKWSSIPAEDWPREIAKQDAYNKKYTATGELLLAGAWAVSGGSTSDVVGGPMGIIVDDDIEAAADRRRPSLALYIGGMGARSVNFHNEVSARMGYESAAKSIQDAYLAGDKKAAIAAVPTRLVEDVALIGPWGKIAEDILRWTDTVLTTFTISCDPASLERVAALVRDWRPGSSRRSPRSRAAGAPGMPGSRRCASAVRPGSG